MKKLAIYCMLLGTILSSCNSLDGFGPKNQTLVNNKVETAIASAYPDAKTVQYVQIAPELLEASLLSRRERLFVGVTTTGLITFAATAIANAELPAAALDYLAANYTGYELLRAGEKKGDGGVIKGYMANIKHNGLFLHIHFDANGTFVELKEKNGKHKGELKNVTAAELPATASDYLKTTFVGYSFVDAKSFTKDAVLSGYLVKITTAESKQVIVHFDATGAFVNSREGELGHGKGGDKGPRSRGKDGTAHVKIEKSALPAAIIAYLDSKYAGYAYKYAKTKSENGVLTEYEVEFTLNGKKYEVYFTPAGEFVKEKIKG